MQHEHKTLRVLVEEYIKVFFNYVFRETLTICPGRMCVMFNQSINCFINRNKIQYKCTVHLGYFKGRVTRLPQAPKEFSSFQEILKISCNNCCCKFHFSKSLSLKI